MATSIHDTKILNIAVVGISGIDEKGLYGSGKSCLCSRFMYPRTTDYTSDHLSVLSFREFSGFVVNNEHFLWWGNIVKSSHEGTFYQFSILEQTEFIDGTTFQTFQYGEIEHYTKRCTETKIESPNKQIYVSKSKIDNQPGRNNDLVFLPEGVMNIDGFICVFDVSIVGGRPLLTQIEFVEKILRNILKVKKPVVIVTTKNDIADRSHLHGVKCLTLGKEFKNIPIVETSAHNNVNVDLGFIVLAQIISRGTSTIRTRMINFMEASKTRKALLRIVELYVTDSALWPQSIRKRKWFIRPRNRCSSIRCKSVLGNNNWDISRATTSTNIDNQLTKYENINVNVRTNQHPNKEILKEGTEKETVLKKTKKPKRKVPATLADFIQSDSNVIPLLIEKCVRFIEDNGLNTVGIYRVSGNHNHVEMLLEKWQEKEMEDTDGLDVNDVATVLKDYISKRLPPIIVEKVLKEVEEWAENEQRKPMASVDFDYKICLRAILRKLPTENYEVLKFLIQHFAKIAKMSKKNQMDSTNLAICLWPTLMPIEFTGLERFEATRLKLQEIVETMIDHHAFIFEDEGRVF